MKTIFVSLLAGLLVSGPRLYAMGRQSERPDYSELERGASGSPANPNPAFSAPRFDQPSAPAAQKEETSDDSLPVPEPRKRTPQKSKSKSESTSVPSTTPAVPGYKPLPVPPPLPVNASEPPLPEESINGLSGTHQPSK